MTYKLKDVLIELTKKCNLNCIHCGSSCDGAVEEKELDLKEWILVIDALSLMGAKKVIFSGGEPTLVPGLGSLIKATYYRGLKYGLITNGFAIDDSLLLHLKHFPPFGVGVSLDGLQMTHNRIRDNEHSWHRAIKTILRLQEAKVRVCVVTTLSKMNVAELPDLANYLWATGIDCWQLQLAMPAGRMKSQKNLLIDEADFKKICNDILVFKQRYTSMQIEAADCFGMAEAGVIRTEAWNGCGAGLSTMAIDAAGRIMPCLSLRGHYCGHITDGIDVIWENSSGFDFNRKFDLEKVPGRGKGYEYSVAGKCGKCEVLESCRGGCASQSYFTHGHFHDSPLCYRRSFKELFVPRSEPAGILDEPSQTLYKYGLPEMPEPIIPGNFPTFDPSEIITKYGLPEDMQPQRWPERPRGVSVLYKYGLPNMAKKA